jgi:hypothetical protein
MLVSPFEISKPVQPGVSFYLTDCPGVTEVGWATERL